MTTQTTIIENRGLISQTRAGGRYTVLTGHDSETGLCEGRYPFNDRQSAEAFAADATAWRKQYC